ncbi:MAG: FHA domain-containing protein [Anaerolineales bacterium]|nr:FHA domain-containing protein [Anaerolineales bacterium]
MADPNDSPRLTDPTGREHVLAEPATSIGRGVENDIVITSKRVSREHARLLRQNQVTVLEDAGSTNGTFLNDERIRESAELTDGDRISIGDVTFVFHDPETTLRDTSAFELEIDRSSGIVRINRRVVALSPKEFLLLAYLNDRRGQVCAKDEIGRAVWPEYREGVYDYQIENLVRRLRNRLEPDPENVRLLLNLRGLGYKLVV